MLSWSTYQKTAFDNEVLGKFAQLLGQRHFKKNGRKPYICFSKLTVSISLPTSYGKSSIYQAAPVIDGLPSPEEPLTIFIVPPVKALTEDKVHSLNVLGPRGLCVSALTLN